MPMEGPSLMQPANSFHELQAKRYDPIQFHGRCHKPYQDTIRISRPQVCLGRRARRTQRPRVRLQTGHKIESDLATDLARNTCFSKRLHVSNKLGE